jgi:hypothetical protein
MFAVGLLFSPSAFSAGGPGSAASPNDRIQTGVSLDKLGDCSWQVTYRGHVYDLSPLTRESLSRPIENDIRYVLQRVPEAGQHLDSMRSYLGQAKAHTILGSIFISGALVTKLLESRLKNDTTRPDYRTVEAAFVGFFLGATIFSFQNTAKAKEELVNAVDEFNAHSPYPIEPATGGATYDSREGK